MECGINYHTMIKGTEQEWMSFVLPASDTMAARWVIILLGLWVIFRTGKFSQHFVFLGFLGFFFLWFHRNSQKKLLLDHQRKFMYIFDWKNYNHALGNWEFVQTRSLSSRRIFVGVELMTLCLSPYHLKTVLHIQLLQRLQALFRLSAFHTIAKLSFLLQGVRRSLVNCPPWSHEGGCLGSSCESSMHQLLIGCCICGFIQIKVKCVTETLLLGFLIRFLLISDEICTQCETEQQKELQRMPSGIRFTGFVNFYFYRCV